MITIGARLTASITALSMSSGFVDRDGIDQLDSGQLELGPRLLEHVGAAAAHRIDDQDRLFGEGVLVMRSFRCLSSLRRERFR